MRRRFVYLAVAAFAIGVAVLLYPGPGRPFVRGHVGDVAATMLVYALLSLAWRGRIAYRATATMAIATAIELGQTWWQVESSAGALLLGTTFDAWDIVAYAVGTAIAVAWDVTRARSIPSGGPPPSRAGRSRAPRSAAPCPES
jgi:hypothetical protein